MRTCLSFTLLALITVNVAQATPEDACEPVFQRPTWSDVKSEDIRVESALERLSDDRFTNMARLRSANPNSLEKGDIVLVSGAVTGADGIKNAKVVGVKKARRGIFGFFLNLILGRREPTVTLEDSTQKIRVPTRKLQGKIFLNETILNGKIVRSGDHVVIGASSGTLGDQSGSFLVPETGKYLVLSGRSLPYLGEFLGMADGKPMVRVTTPKFDVVDVQVEPTEIALAGGRSRESVEAKLDLANSIELEFKKKETVRFRGNDFKMYEGEFRSRTETSASIRTPEGMIEVPIERVFKRSGTEPPSTPDYQRPGTRKLETTFGEPNDLLEKFLNGAAKLTSLSDFQELPTKEKLEAVMAFTLQFVQYEKAARKAEGAGNTSYTDILACGSGVCRHLANLVGMVLKESGFAAHRVAYMPPGEAVGHGWVEVTETIPGRRILFWRLKGHTQTWVVDPSSGKQGWVGTMEEVQEKAILEPESLAAKFHSLNPALKIHSSEE